MEAMKMNDTLLRHWRMLREVPRYPRRIDTATLRERLVNAGYDTTLRTIQRDLIKLSASLPLLADEAKPQGWSWRADAQQLDMPTLEPQAALVFHLAEKYLRPLLPATTLEYLSPWFRTASGVLDNQGNGLSEWRKKVRVLARGQPLQPPVLDADVQDLVTQALLQNKRFSTRYRPRNGKADKDYVVNPLGLVVRDQALYLVCTLWDYPDIKQLVLNRMRSATLLDEPAKPLKGFDLDDYIATGEFGWPAESGKTIKLVAEFSRDAAVTITERPMEKNQKIEDVDEKTVRLTATVPDTKELRSWLLGFGNQVEILYPQSLRNEVYKTVQELERIYSSTARPLE
jgi:predicted DNA-binding transcriptional regulator YafY